jgi:hypothetical protein
VVCVETLIEHLVKLELSPPAEPRRGWRETVLPERAAIKRLIKATPSLAPSLDAVIAEELPTAIQLAVASLTTYGESPLRLPEEISCTPDQVLGSWLPYPPCSCNCRSTLRCNGLVVCRRQPIRPEFRYAVTGRHMA